MKFNSRGAGNPGQRGAAMLLVLDVGNTNTVIGVFEGERLVTHYRVGTRRDKTTDEWGILFLELLVIKGMSFKDFDGVAISSVVPPVLPVLIELVQKFFRLEPLVVGPGVKTGMPIHVDNPKEVGADRIVNAVAAYEAEKTAVIVVDFGTATTFDVVSAKGSFEGGVIAPGLAISMEALFREASKLPRVELTRPRQVIGKNTVSAMQSGIIFGYAGLVDSIVLRTREEMKASAPDDPEPHVIATGGLARLIAAETKTINKVDEDLTLRGLQIIYQRNA
jgi:type III pantothenate kinase